MKQVLRFIPLVLAVLSTPLAQSQTVNDFRKSPAAQGTLESAEIQRQAASPLRVDTVIPAELSKSLDARKCQPGTKVEAKSTMDLLANGRIVLPRNTRIEGHLTAVKAHSKDSPESQLGIAFDRVVMKDGQELPLQAQIQAIGLPMNAFVGVESMPTGPLSGSMPANLPGAAPAGMPLGGPSRDGSNPAPIPIDASLADGPGGNSVQALGQDSRGVIGIRDLSLSSSPPDSVVSSSTNNVHLYSGTQLILRTQ